MFITTTISKPRADQIESVETYMASFLPRLKELSGVEAVYHYLRPEQHEDPSVILPTIPEVDLGQKINICNIIFFDIPLSMYIYD